MGKHKNLRDVIYGDRAVVRANQKTFGGSVVDFGAYGYSKSSKASFGPSCYESHPALKLPGTELVIFGGSCINPKVKDADVYIGFDAGMKFTERHWPWKKGAEVLFKIKDMGTPSKPDDFKKLVSWTKKQMEDGRKVHCGCIGGHGRTGMFLAALVSEFGEKDAISYVREHYCQKAVESSEQVEFLGEHFGIKAVKATKQYSIGSYSGSKSYYGGSSSSVKRYDPLPSMGNIWECN